jgi:indole-3-glycerol phosphate synthase
VILDEILAHKRQEVAERKRSAPLQAVCHTAERMQPARGLRSALVRPGLSVIAEVKRKSPAKGVLRANVDPAAQAAIYAAAGAAAISVLTDQRFFDGSDADLAAVRERVQVPVLRKDFVVDEYQVWEARSIGADAILLIVRALDPDRLTALRQLSLELGMDALVEVHNEAEVRMALQAGADLVGINNRDLDTMTVDLAATPRVRPLIPGGVAVVSESGIRGPADLGPLLACGIDAVLVGEALMSSVDPGGTLAALARAGVAA